MPLINQLRIVTVHVAFFDSPLSCLATNSRDSIASNFAVITVVVPVEVVEDFVFGQLRGSEVSLLLCLKSL